VFLTTHHGLTRSGAPALVQALRARVGIMNNGAHKGGAAEYLKTLRATPGFEDLWQLHYAIDAPEDLNSSKDLIANLEEKCAGYSIQLTAESDGSFSVKNTRNGFTKRYEPRKP
jgi:competence protein ComEC